MTTTADFTESVAHNTQGLEAITTGPCPGCETCRKDYDYPTMEALAEAWTTGDLDSEPHFSWSACDLCGSTLGGDREVWHAIDKNGEIIHGDNACTDCVMYLANGDIPEDWSQR